MVVGRSAEADSNRLVGSVNEVVNAKDVAPTEKLSAPFPYFGGKSAVAEIVWQALGDVPIYIEPFFGSGAVLLGRPHAPRREVVNDLDGFVANFWRGVSTNPKCVARYCDAPSNETDLHARHR